jgi:hypothetical protein
MGRTPCTEPQFLYSRSIPLLPLWAVRPVQSLSACTRVTYTFSFDSANFTVQMSPRHWQLPQAHPIPRLHTAINVAPTRDFIYPLTDNIFGSCPAYPNTLGPYIGNYTLADPHRQYKNTYTNGPSTFYSHSPNCRTVFPLYCFLMPLLPPWSTRSAPLLPACTVELYLYSPYGPYGLYRASVPVQ